MSFTIGIDYETNSVRAIVMDCSDGREEGSSVINYPSRQARRFRRSSVAQHSITLLNPIRPSVPENEVVYNRLYALYRQMHDAFGGVNRTADLSGVMKELIRIREEQTKA